MKVNKNLIKNFIKDYNNGLSTIKIGKKYNVSYTTVYNYLKKSGVRIRSASERTRKYKILEDFFDNIDTQEKAYFLGILYADGCNYPERNIIKLGLRKGDRNILEKLSKLIYQCNRPIIQNKDRIVIFNNIPKKFNGLCELNITNKHLSNKLINLGLVKNKSHKLKFPVFLSNALIPHFIRGYFDGDGSLSFGKSKQISISILGTKNFCEGLKQCVFNNININSTVCNAKKGLQIQQFVLHGNVVGIKFLHWIYKDATIYLDRKYNKYIEIQSTIPKRYGNCIVCGDKHYGKGYCQYHHYEYIGRRERRKRYLIFKDL